MIPTSADDIAHARRVIDIEADALKTMSAQLDGKLGETLASAAQALAALKGRVIITGMGKSGHIARKLAATFASTGTTAHYIHPGEASHGDLGMIGPEDAVIAFSKSGDTSELADILHYAKRFRIPLIGVTEREGSSLAEAADFPLIIPACPEACPMGLAPTTSTTLMLALGDALAVTLLQRKGFTADDFRVFHPGGKLGKQLMKVKALMRPIERVPLVTRDQPMSEVMLDISEMGTGCAGVVDADGRLTGIITDGDLRRHMAPTLLAQPAGTVMTASPQTIRPDALAAEALAIMNERRITGLFVVDDSKPLGFVHIHDLLLAGVG
ncbi:MAG: KpsF/GutQ family sugar-phosphate isomerase [Alphaproteobacteria bacterium]|nr:KpsF/GutQ family sugar-phosphate isomerase [Alphaproteobacteria bacterium]MBU0798771.1 KpsF/GutQ family sugar-phosphate isomerase [Alphaproteobacteria bacterium]MBU0886034.1 KpsF/GutQ family sugar-phosphate isomerase [Alphaproteobacteria bacterium]MBU1812023.1 KpsF/GutQ family sugar-phosphate isomerase [Alphaproteobacteria bacterium]MBU2089011.1 KpsF/GutQ family sugar-phosphate isomerase [Alphaproteobacteria bacterium]